MKEFSSLFSLILNVDHRLSLTRDPEKGITTLTVKLGEDHFEKQVLERNNQENGKICVLGVILTWPFWNLPFFFLSFPGRVSFGLWQLWDSSIFLSVQSLSHVRLCDPMNHSTPGLPVHHQLLEFTQTHVLWVSDAIQPSHPPSSPSSPAPNPSQHQGLFKWVSSSHQVAKVLEFQL